MPNSESQYIGQKPSDMHIVVTANSVNPQNNKNVMHLGVFHNVSLCERITRLNRILN